MLYWKYSANRIFFLNEYWILIPSAILANYVIIRKIRLNREKMEQLKGTDMVDVDYIRCNIEKGVRYLDNNRLRNIIHDLYRHKRKRKIIYITATAICHLANRYGQTFLALPFAVGDFGLTNVYQAFRKGVVTTGVYWWSDWINFCFRASYVRFKTCI